jgi:hypothetical protein
MPTFARFSEPSFSRFSTKSARSGHSQTSRGSRVPAQRLASMARRTSDLSAADSLGAARQRWSATSFAQLIFMYRPLQRARTLGAQHADLITRVHVVLTMDAAYRLATWRTSRASSPKPPSALRRVSSRHRSSFQIARRFGFAVKPPPDFLVGPDRSSSMTFQGLGRAVLS